MPDIYQELINLAEGEMYPFHMPGHKRNLQSTPLKGAFRCDITEIDGFDNLHDEKGIILEAEERANLLYGAEETFFLVNGSTSGVLSAVSAAVSEGGTILAARGSHKSFYHAAYLRGLDIEYLEPRMISEYGIFDSYNAEDVKRALDKAEVKPEAVFITSPTYEGKCSDIEGIARVCHDEGIILIVDEAHGAHFGFGEGVPESAVNDGADIVIHSLHKTLPAMTQTALIHVQGKLADRERLKRFLRIYQSSSPSYVLMSSIDLCMKEMQENGKEFVEKLVMYRKKIQKETSGCKVLKIPDLSELEDPAKVLVYADSEAMTGQELYDILREDYLLQLEMAGEHYALAIITGWDTDEGIERLIKAICEIDECLQKKAGARLGVKEENYSIPKKEMSLQKAWDSERETVSLKLAEGRICGDFVNLYPPGIPLIVPGEVIGGDLIKDLERYFAEGLNVQGILEVENSENKGIIDIDKRGILCVKRK
ncbi:aminotransferase class I/II-fold pyridoxal phosphate-dependent enzyme [Butyrivibrio sp. XPD2006]|uniref:aminotransferase class I/II-fold pyridoxal phosphate-dependent enzyme n=1 Tax=Butyrivibrio sp. XPD2006 TaxID=1280668 RepID=UPI0003B468C1|nr:aminotransferase class I/II-fold pyridoxal phosphate-dependent enzyme [Butyrivibrio sp. XPD2006]